MHSTTTDSFPDKSPDPLLACLLALAKLEGTTHTASSLVSGLPLVDNRLTPDLFVRAAERANLLAKVVSRNLSDISNIVLPAVLLLHDNKACLLMSIDRENSQVTLLDTETERPYTIPREDLEKEYNNYAIYVRADHRIHQTTEASSAQHHHHWFWSVLAKSWRIYRDVLLASLLINIFAISMPMFTMNVYDRVVPNRAIETLWVLAIGITIIFVFDMVLKSLRSYFIELSGKKADILLSSILFERMLGLKLAHRPASVGVFASQMRDFDTVKNFITTSTILALVDLPFLIIFLCFIGFVGGSLIFIPLLIVPIVICLGYFLQKTLSKHIENSIQANNQKNATLVESLTAIETIKSLGVEGKMQRVWESVVGQTAFWGQKSRVLSSSIVNASSFLQQFATVVAVIYGVYLIGDGKMTMGALIACVMLMGRVLAPLAQLANMQTSYYNAKISLNALNDLMSKPVEKPLHKTFLHKPDLKGKVEFRNVSFAYPNQKQLTLQNVSFTIQHGEKVAIIGRIGSGKTTILKLMLSLYEPIEGSILIDDIDIGQLDPADLRKNTGYVSQEIMLFRGTLRSNINYAQLYVDDRDLINAVNFSGVAEFARRFPAGLDSPVGERGENLSGGQRQAIGLARAYLNDPAIYLLDEPTSQMDNSSEEFIKTSLQENAGDKTLILVTHKMPMLTMVDRIIVMEQGMVVADGPRDVVLDALKSGKIAVRKP